jgi:probable HAF family extracellular repeat protein
MTRKIVAALAAIAALSGPLVHAAQPRFSLTSLAPGFTPYAFNTDTVAVGMMWNGAGVVVDDGAISFLAGLGGNWAFGQGINTAGIVVGSADDRENMPRAVRWVASAAQDIGTLPGGTYASAYGVNDSGQIVGISGTEPSGVRKRAFIWTNGKMKNLGTLPGGVDSAGTAVNAKGQVTGWSHTTRDGADFTHAFRWHKGVMTDLGHPGTEDAHSAGTAINRYGDVTGYFSSPTGTRPFLYRDGSMVDIGNAWQTPTATCEGNGINAARHIVGRCQDTNQSGSWAFFYNGRRSLLLDNLLDASGEGWNVGQAIAIDDAGRILGTAIGPDGRSHGVLLTPVPPAAQSVK